MEKKWKIRKVKGVVISFVFFLLALLFLSIYFINITVQEIKDINKKKEDTKEIYNNIQKITNKWINYNDFVKNSKDIDKSNYINEIVSNIKKDFYNKNFINEKNTRYSNFITNKKKEINSKENIEKKERSNKKISKILPYYTENYTGIDEQYLTDFKFINYIESIIETFNLKNESSWIWIKWVVMVDDYYIWEQKQQQQQSLENNIFYIPLSLNLSWTKENIINFLKYIENVWNINITKTKDLNIINNDILLLGWKKIILKWDNFTESYNIYNNQAISIDKLEMKDYIDTYYWTRNDAISLNDFVKFNEWRQKYEINISLKFYIKWIRNYKMEEMINKFLEIYKLTETIVSTNLKNPRNEAEARSKFNSINNYLKEISNDINMIKKNVRKKEDLENLLKKVLTYEKILFNINLQIWIDEIINKLSVSYQVKLKEILLKLNNKNISDIELEKIKQYNIYLLSIEDKIKDLNIKDWEDKELYKKRVNTKSIYDSIIEINYNLSTKK